MATTYPVSLQDMDSTRGTALQALNSPSHVTHHALEDDTLEALQAKVGIDSSAVTTSLDYILKNTSSSNPGHKHTLANGATDITATVTELNYVGGVTSAIQTQMNLKAPLASPTFTGTVTIPTGASITAPVIATIVNTGTLTLPTSTDTLVGRATTDTLTNKRITKRTGTTTSHATPTINTDNVDMYLITAQTEAITSMTTNLSGTPTQGQTLWIAITGTAARAITWGASFEASTVALPTTTVTTARLDVGFVWNTVTSKWRCVAAV